MAFWLHFIWHTQQSKGSNAQQFRLIEHWMLNGYEKERWMIRKKEMWDRTTIIIASNIITDLYMIHLTMVNGRWVICSVGEKIFFSFIFKTFLMMLNSSVDFHRVQIEFTLVLLSKSATLMSEIIDFLWSKFISLNLI